MTGAAALELVARSGAVGAGGAGFPTHAKLGARVEVLIANGAECEPMLYTNQELMRTEAATVVAGLLAAAEIVGAVRTVLAVKAKYTEPIAALNAALKAAGAAAVELFLLPDFYPAGDEQALVAEVTGRIVPEAGLPLDVGVVVINVETLANVAVALQGQPVTHKLVTVTGAVKRPVTLRVPVGAPMSALIAAAGGPTVSDWGIVEGGPLMGRVELDPERPVTKTTGGLIVLPLGHPRISRPRMDVAVEYRRAKTACIRCCRCTELCPRYLQGHDLRPHQVMQSLALFPLSDPLYNQAWLCCECGICETFSCPMGLSPRLVLGNLKRQFGAQGRRYPRQPKEYRRRTDYQIRRVTGKRLLRRLGLDGYNRPAPLVEEPLTVPAVSLLLRQHVGVPAVPVVAEGDRVKVGQTVAEPPAGKLGAAVHASVDGVVTRVTAELIRIEGVGSHA
jgi:Na+-translocating ferredoxin:NAD+ oxidoreductase RnfC subunit